MTSCYFSICGFALCHELLSRRCTKMGKSDSFTTWDFFSVNLFSSLYIFVFLPRNFFFAKQGPRSFVKGRLRNGGHRHEQVTFLARCITFLMSFKNAIFDKEWACLLQLYVHNFSRNWLADVRNARFQD